MSMEWRRDHRYVFSDVFFAARQAGPTSGGKVASGSARSFKKNHRPDELALAAQLCYCRQHILTLDLVPIVYV